MPTAAQTFNALCTEGRFQEACAVAAANPDILAAPVILERYIRALKVGAPEQEEEALLNILLRQPEYRPAQGRFFELHRNKVPGPEVAARYRAHTDAGHSAIILAKLAQLAMGEDDFEGALALADQAMAASPTPALVEQLRKLLAKLLRWYGQRGLADDFLSRPDQPNDAAQQLVNLLEARQGGVIDGSIPPLIERLLAFDAHRQRAYLALLDYRWSYEGATASLLEDSLTWACDDADARLAAERIALAVQLGLRGEAAGWLAATPEAARKHRNNLPVATLLAEHPDLMPVGVNPDHVEADARLFADLARGSQDLADRLSDPGVSVGIVGNSPCERGRGCGEAIDRHDLVIRFNRVPDVPELQADYGSKTDVHVVATGGNPYELPAPGARFALMTVPSALYRNRGWIRAKSLLHYGYIVATVLGDSYNRLIRVLKMPPSNGLRMCAYMAERRPGLAAVDTYGFAFVDQLADRNSAHYAGGYRAANHNWLKEAEIFQDLMKRSPGPAA